jgi:transposase-like protein
MAFHVGLCCGWVMDTAAAPFEISTAEESAHTSSHKSARIPRIEVITRGERRRRWTTEQKQTIAAQSLAPGVSPTDVARQYGISSGQLYTWRQALLAAQPGAVARPNGSFARVEVAAAATKAATREPDVSELPPEVQLQVAGLIEIVLPNGSCVRVDAQVDEQALRRVLAVLRG